MLKYITLEDDSVVGGFVDVGINASHAWGFKTAGAAIVVATDYLILPEKRAAFLALGLLFILDWATGMVRAWRTHTLRSRALINGIGKLLAYVVFVAAAVLVARAAGTPLSWLPTAACGYVAVTEFVSIIENLYAAGFAVPAGPLLRKLASHGSFGDVFDLLSVGSDFRQRYETADVPVVLIQAGFVRWTNAAWLLTTKVPESEWKNYTVRLLSIKETRAALDAALSLSPGSPSVPVKWKWRQPGGQLVTIKGTGQGVYHNGRRATVLSIYSYVPDSLV